MSMNTILSDKQSDLLRYLYRQTGPVPVDHLDGRSLRALRSREFVDERKGWVTLSDAGRTHFESLGRREPKRRRKDSAPRNPRAEAIARAIEALDAALPPDAEVAVGPMFAYADDVVQGLRDYARGLAKRPPASAAA
jgi:hypothetical protein